MELEVYKKPIKDGVLRLELVGPDEDGDLILHAVDNDGKPVKRGRILYVRSDGTIFLACGVDPNIGLKVNSHTTVVVENAVYNTGPKQRSTR